MFLVCSVHNIYFWRLLKEHELEHGASISELVYSLLMDPPYSVVWCGCGTIRIRVRTDYPPMT